MPYSVHILALATSVLLKGPDLPSVSSSSAPVITMLCIQDSSPCALVVMKIDLGSTQCEWIHTIFCSYSGLGNLGPLEGPPIYLQCHLVQHQLLQCSLYRIDLGSTQCEWIHAIFCSNGGLGNQSPLIGPPTSWHSHYVNNAYISSTSNKCVFKRN